MTTSYADAIRRGEHLGKRRRGRFTAAELRRMSKEARALIALGETGWLPDETERSEQERFDLGDRLEGERT